MSGPSVGTVTILSMGNYNNKNQDIFLMGLQDEQDDFSQVRRHCKLCLQSKSLTSSLAMSTVASEKRN